MYIGVILASDNWEGESIIHQVFLLNASDPDDAFNQVKAALLSQVNAKHLGEDGYVSLNRVAAQCFSQAMSDGTLDCTDSSAKKPDSFRSMSDTLSNLM